MLYNSQMLTDKIKNSLKDKQISQKTLLSDCGLGVNTLTKLSNGSDIQTNNLIKIANYLDLSLDYLTDRSDNPYSHKEQFNNITPAGDLSVNDIYIIKSYERLSDEGKLNLQNYIEFLLYNEEKNKVDSGITKNSPSLEIASVPKEFKEFKVYDFQASAGLGKYFGEEPVYTMEILEVTPINFKSDHAITIKGDSMQPTISDGSYVFIKKQPKIENGEVGIFILNDEVFCKRLILEDNKAILRSDNSKYPDIVLTPSDVVITIGKVLLDNKKY